MIVGRRKNSEWCQGKIKGPKSTKPVFNMDVGKRFGTRKKNAGVMKHRRRTTTTAIKFDVYEENLIAF